MNIEDSGRLTGRPPFVDQSPGKSDLVDGQLWWPAEPNAARFGRNTARTGPLGNQRTLEFGDASKYGQNHATGRRGGVGPWLGERTEPCTGPLKPLRNIEEITGRPSQPVEARDRHDVISPKLVDQPDKLRSVALRSGDLLFINPPTAGHLQGRPLLREILVVGGNARIAYEHGAPVAKVIAKLFPFATDFCNIKIS